MSLSVDMARTVARVVLVVLGAACGAACTLPDVRVHADEQERELNTGPMMTGTAGKVQRARMFSGLSVAGRTMTGAKAGGGAGGMAGASGSHAGAPAAAMGGSGGQPTKAIPNKGGMEAGAGGAGGGGVVVADDMDPTTICAGGEVGTESVAADMPELNSSEPFASLFYLVDPPNKIVSFKTIMVVPKNPLDRNAVVSIFPGLQSRGGSNPGDVGLGVLDPLLTWGSYVGASFDASWRVSGMYEAARITGPTQPLGNGPNRSGGDTMDVEAGDRLFVDMSVTGTEWTQTITNLRNGLEVAYAKDLKGQEQNLASWIIEAASGGFKSSTDTVFEKSVLTFSDPVSSCSPTNALTIDHFTAPTLSADGLHCCYERIVFSTGGLSRL